MTGRWIAALLGAPLLLAAAWVLGGAVFNHTPADLGNVVVVSPPTGERPGTPAPAPRIGTPAPTRGPSAPDPSSLPSATAAVPDATPASPAEPAAPTGATRVTAEPAPPAGDDDDDDDGIEDGGIIDDDTDS